jgi:hypothetical protein
MNYPAEDLKGKAFPLSERNDLPLLDMLLMQVLGTLPSDKSTLFATLEYICLVYYVRIMLYVPH